MTSRAHRILAVIAAVIVATALSVAPYVAGNDLERLERRVAELEELSAVQTDAMTSLTESVERAHRICVARGECVEPDKEGQT